MQIVFLFYDGMTALDAIGPHEVLTRIPDVNIKRVAKSKGVVKTEAAGLTLHAEYDLSQVKSADILVVPGTGRAFSFSKDSEVLDWVRQIHQGSTLTTSVCTGSLILGAAGLLQGIKATSHWAVMDRLEKWGAIPVSNRVVTDGKIITAAGVSAGIDMALTIVSKVVGVDLAKMLQLGIEYDPCPPFDCGSPNKIDAELLNILRSRMIAKFEPLP